MTLRFTAATLLAASCFAQKPPAIQGTLTVSGKHAPVAFVCAYEEPDPFDNKKVRTSVLLALEPPPLTATCKENYRHFGKRMAAGGPPALLAYLEQPGFSWSAGMLLAKGSSYSYSFSSSGSEPKLKFEPTADRREGQLSGRLVTREEFKMSDFPPMNVDVRFSVPLEKMAAKGAEVSGDAARKHPATLAAKGFLEAMSKADEKGVRSKIVEAERAQFDKMMSAGDKAKFFEMMREMAKDTLSMSDVTVGSKGKLTEVVFQRKSETGKSSSNFFLLQEQGEWRVTQQR